MPGAALHITLSLRIIRKHRNATTIGVARAHEIVKQAALAAAQQTETNADRAMREELERRTRLTIAELAAVADDWPE